MSTERMLEKYIQLIESDGFARYEKDFAQRITSALSKGYIQTLNETPMVRIVENVVNDLHDLTTPMRNDRPYPQLCTRAVFIHGDKSQVEFDYYGESAQRELGDMVFIISVVFNGQKYFEKLTINQYKKDKKRSKGIIWSIDNKKQLYLLSRFPTFRGIKGSLIPIKDFSLVNYSGCLGSFGLLYRPGDFAFVSAGKLDSFIGSRKSLKIGELYHFISETEKHLIPPFLHTCPDIEVILYLMHRFNMPDVFRWYLALNLFRNYHYAHNVFEFAHRYLTVGIGEPVYMKLGIHSPQARNFLREFLSAVGSKAKQENLENVLNFVRGFFEYGYAGDEGESGFTRDMRSDFGGGGMGIIHTTINLGE